MASPLEGSIRRTIGKAMRSIFYPVTVVRLEQSGPVWEPVFTEVEYPCKGFIDDYSDFALTNSNILSGDRKVVVLADSLEITPGTSDLVRVRGQTFSVLNVATDPAEATWTLQARR